MTTAVNMPLTLLYPELFGLLLLLLAAVTSALMPNLEPWSKRFFLCFYSVLILMGVIFSIDILTYMNPRYLALSKCLPLVEYLLFSLPLPLLTLYLLYSCGDDWKKSPFFYLAAAFLGVYFLLLLVGQFTEVFYYTKEDGSYYLTKWTPVLFYPLIAVAIVNQIILFKGRRNLSKRYFHAFLICNTMVLFAVTFHAHIINFVVLNIALTIGAVTMYLFILTDQIQQYMRQQADLANQKANVMVLQMRPHFIYNTMSSLYYLVDQNPKQAQKVILDFTSYLRKNFNAISSSDLIPFTEELEHVRAYLAVELVQFEDFLSVEYDIPHTEFTLPPLTLEPLVENAIKYGLDPDSDPLNILIRTRERESDHLIMVQDNGPGFDPKGVFDSNNALSIIKQRLHLMCKGSISITSSSQGGGCLIEISIPKEK